jgi:UPF0755 protein
MRLAVRIFFLLVLLLLALTAGAGYLFYKAWHSPGPLAADTTIVIDPGSHTIVIGRDLQQAGIVQDWRLFVLGVKLFANGRPLRAGEYKFGAGMSPEQVMHMLISGATYARRVTVPEGYTTAQALRLVASAEGLVGEMPAEPPAEGRLLPETYFYTRGERRQVMIHRMSEAMQQALAKLWAERAADLPYASAEEALVLASIVEKETSLPVERARIAGVFVNRLRRGMPLQSDPTVIYIAASGQGPLGRDISSADLQAKSPYNTYLNKGLPPGPICNPGLASIQAVLHPMATKDLYFVADGSGGHAFAQTLADHNRNVAAYRKLLVQQAQDPASGGGAVIADPLPAGSAAESGAGGTTRASGGARRGSALGGPQGGPPGGPPGVPAP